MNRGQFSSSFLLFFIFNFILFALIACEVHSFLFIEGLCELTSLCSFYLIVSLAHLCFVFKLFTYSFVNNYFFQTFQLLFLPWPTICFIWVIYIITYRFNNLCALLSCIRFKLDLFLYAPIIHKLWFTSFIIFQLRCLCFCLLLWNYLTITHKEPSSLAIIDVLLFFLIFICKV